MKEGIFGKDWVMANAKPLIGYNRSEHVASSVFNAWQSMCRFFIAGSLKVLAIGERAKRARHS